MAADQIVGQSVCLFWYSMPCPKFCHHLGAVSGCSLNYTKSQLGKRCQGSLTAVVCLERWITMLLGFWGFFCFVFLVGHIKCKLGSVFSCYHITFLVLSGWCIVYFMHALKCFPMCLAAHRFSCWCSFSLSIFFRINTCADAPLLQIIPEIIFWSKQKNVIIQFNISIQFSLFFT